MLGYWNTQGSPFKGAHSARLPARSVANAPGAAAVAQLRSNAW